MPSTTSRMPSITSAVVGPPYGSTGWPSSSTPPAPPPTPGPSQGRGPMILVPMCSSTLFCQIQKQIRRWPLGVLSFGVPGTSRLGGKRRVWPNVSTPPAACTLMQHALCAWLCSDTRMRRWRKPWPLHDVWPGYADRYYPPKQIATDRALTDGCERWRFPGPIGAIGDCLLGLGGACSCARSVAERGLGSTGMSRLPR